MNVLKPRNLLSTAALVAVTFFLVGAAPHVVSRTPAWTPVHRHGLDLVQQEVNHCEARGERSRDECIDEAEGKALIRHAEWLARLEAGGGRAHDDSTDAAADALDQALRVRSSDQ
jgi:hypothetical protein